MAHRKAFGWLVRSRRKTSIRKSGSISGCQCVRLATGKREMSASLSENAYNPVSILIWGWLKPWTRSRWFDAQVIQNCVFCNTLIGVELRRWARMAQPIELSFYGTSRCRQKWYTLGNGADRNYTPWGMAQTDMIHPGKWCRQIWYTLGNGIDRNDTPWGMAQTDMIHPGKWCRQKWYTLGNGTDRYDTP